jgi:hypothetical protein
MMSFQNTRHTRVEQSVLASTQRALKHQRKDDKTQLVIDALSTRDAHVRVCELRRMLNHVSISCMLRNLLRAIAVQHADATYSIASDDILRARIAAQTVVVQQLKDIDIAFMKEHYSVLFN